MAARVVAGWLCAYVCAFEHFGMLAFVNLTFLHLCIVAFLTLLQLGTVAFFALLHFWHFCIFDTFYMLALWHPFCLLALCIWRFCIVAFWHFEKLASM